MNDYKTPDGLTLHLENDSGVVYSDDVVIVNIQAFKETGHYYTSFRLILEGYTAKEIEVAMQSGHDDVMNAYHIYADIIDFLKYRPFYKDMYLVVNCDVYYPIMLLPQ